MALALKLAIGGSAVSSLVSMVLITAGERARLVDPVPVADVEFAQRFPIMILPPSDEWRARAQPPVQNLAQAEPAAPQASKIVQSGHNRILRAKCRKVYRYVRGHRTWSCRR